MGHRPQTSTRINTRRWDTWTAATTSAPSRTVASAAADPSAAGPTPAGRVRRHRAAGDHRGRLRHRRGAALAWAGGAATAGELDRHGARAGGAHPHARAGVRRALQPGHLRCGLAHRPPVRLRADSAGPGRLRRGSAGGGRGGCRARQPHVRAAGARACRYRAKRRRGGVRRGRRHGRSGHGCVRAGPQRPCCLVGPRRRRLHRGGLLVHVQYVVRQPGCHGRADVLGHVCRDRARVRAAFCGRSGGRRPRGRRARPGPLSRRRRCGGRCRRTA